LEPDREAQKKQCKAANENEYCQADPPRRQAPLPPLVSSCQSVRQVVADVLNLMAYQRKSEPLCPGLHFESVNEKLILPGQGNLFTNAFNPVIVYPMNALTDACESCFSGSVAHVFREREFRAPAALNEVRIVKGQEFGLPKLSMEANKRQHSIKINSRTALVALLFILHMLAGIAVASWILLEGRFRGTR
jgi:hypothetical protein